MDLASILADLEHPELLPTVAPYWEDSLRSQPSCPEFLQPETITANWEWSGLPDSSLEPLLAAAAWIRSRPALVHLAWHCNQLLFEYLDYDGLKQWPRHIQGLGHRSGAFYLLIALDMVPRTRAVHTSMQVPETITQDTCSQLASFAENYRRMTDGGLGVPASQIHWLRHYPAGRLFRLGRMEYMLKPFSGQLQAYRHRQTRQTAALSLGGVTYNRAGYIAGDKDTDCWTSTLTEKDGLITGTPITPMGFACNRPIQLPADEWRCVLRPGDLCLDMHIPAGGGMTLERCGDSMRRAAAFFQRFFPDQKAAAIICSSWIFNTQLEQLQLSSDNLVRFQHELYLFPIPAKPESGLWFIFQQDNVHLDPKNAPRKTSLQRAAADFLAAGHTWRSGAMFFLLSDLDHFGTQVYRRTWKTLPWG